MHMWSFRKSLDVFRPDSFNAEIDKKKIFENVSDFEAGSEKIMSSDLRLEILEWTKNADWGKQTYHP